MIYPVSPPRPPHISSSPTIGTIAEVAGVSKSTVSLALRNSPKIQKETCLKIQAIARELNYRPNPLVAAQMSHIRLNNTRKTAPTIGFLNTWINETDRTRQHWNLIGRYYKGAKARAEELGFALELLEFDRTRYSSQRIQQVLHSRGIEGLVIAPLKPSKEQLELKWSDYALAAINSFEDFDNIHRISYDHFTCMQHVLNLLRDRGYRRIGFITNQGIEAQCGHLFSGGFLEYQSRLIPEDERIPLLNLRASEDIATQEELDTMLSWYLQFEPEVIVGMRDVPLRHFESMGYKAPDDMGYVALEWNDELEGCSGYYQSMRKVGAAAIDSLAVRLYQNQRGLPRRSVTTLLVGEFVEGATLRAPVLV